MSSDSDAISHQGLRWLLTRARPAIPWITVSIGLGAAAGMVLIIQAGCLARIVHAVAIDGMPREELRFDFLVLIAAAIVKAALVWGRGKAGFHAGAQVRGQVRMALVDHITRLGPVYAAGHAGGALTSAVMEQVEGLHGFFAHYLPQLALAVAVPLAILAFVFPISWAAGGLLLVTAPLIPFFMVLIGMGARSISQRYFTALARLSAHFLDALQGLPTLKLFDRARAEADRVAETSGTYRVQTMSVLQVAFLSSAVLEFFSAIAIALVAVYLGMSFLGYYDFGAWDRPLTLYGGLFILLLAPEFYHPLRELGAHYHTRAQAAGAAEEIMNILNTPLPETAATARDPISGDCIDLRVENLCLRYPNTDRAVLSDIGLDIPAGQRIALVGESGAGKTSLINAILGFVHPGQGQISANGVPLHDLAPERQQDAFAWVGQNPILFFGTIRENILMGRRGAHAADVQAAARATGVLEFAQRLPDGLETRVGEGGYGLSRGQAQRVALARAWLKTAPILVLDEPTAGLDPLSAGMIMAALKRLPRGRTVLMATHRLAALTGMDRIAVMADGRIVACDTYAALMAERGLFYRLVTRIQGGADDPAP